jgi:hypothetical protein
VGPWNTNRAAFSLGVALQPLGSRPYPVPQPVTPMILPPVTMDLGLLLISIGVVNLWRARQAS